MLSLDTLSLWISELGHKSGYIDQILLQFTLVYSNPENGSDFDDKFGQKVGCLIY